MRDIVHDGVESQQPQRRRAIVEVITIVEVINGQVVFLPVAGSDLEREKILEALSLLLEAERRR